MINHPLSSACYAASAEGYDEVFLPDGSARPGYGRLLRHLDKLGGEELSRRRIRIRSILQDNDLVSVTRRRGRSEGMDCLPLTITPQEWQGLEAGLRQRARLFNALAADMYGEQALWKSGVLPPALLHRNPGFLHPAWGYRPPQGIWVHLSGTGVVRGSDGTFYAVSDQLQSPEGLGKALENRLAASRAFPELFRELHALRLAGFFKALQEMLGRLSPGPAEERRIALLAAEPESERRAEDAILSRYLGFQLVENDDLSIRRQQVFLKTLAGLKRVDTLLRRVEDGFCDPLELRIESGEGCSGLMMCMRAGNVTLANAIGCGALEAPLFRAFLPEISRRLLGEELLLPGPECRWLGEEQAWDAVQASPEGYVFRPAFTAGGERAFAELTPVAQLTLLDEIAQAPAGWVAEGRPGASTAPVWTDKQWRGAAVSCRFFTLLETGGGAQVMPGGLGTYELCNDPAGRRGEKDIWVLSPETVPYFSLLAPADQPVRLSRAGGDLPSRTADGLYMIGRDIEAAESLARLARGIALRLTDQTLAESPEVPVLLQACSESTDGRLLSDPENALWSLVMKQEQPGGMQNLLAEVRRLAVQLRDRLSADTWHFVHNFGEFNRPDGEGAVPLLPYLARIINDALAFAGLAGESMTRGHGWRFQEMGRRIERSRRCLTLLKASLVQVLPGDLAEMQLLQALLEIGDSSMTYHRRYGGRIQVAPVADLFLCDETSPRSLAFQVARLLEECGALPPQTGEEALLSPLYRELLRLSTDLRLVDIHALVQECNGRREQLAVCLNQWTAAIERSAELLSRNYLNHVPQQAWRSTMATEV